VPRRILSCPDKQQATTGAHIAAYGGQRLVDLMRQRRDHLAKFGQSRHMDQFSLQLMQPPLLQIGLHCKRPRRPLIDRALLDQQYQQHEARIE